MEFKFRPSMLRNVLGALWISVAILNFALMIFIASFSFGLAAMPLLTGALSMIVGFYYLDPFKRNYVVLETAGLSVHRGLFRNIRQISLESIEMALEVGNQIRLQERNGRETTIHLDRLENKGVRELRRVLLEHGSGLL